ncbi:19062_t:CDS:2, partial [Gigaspora rosea]
QQRNKKATKTGQNGTNGKSNIHQQSNKEKNFSKTHSRSAQKVPIPIPDPAPQGTMKSQPKTLVQQTTKSNQRLQHKIVQPRILERQNRSRNGTNDEIIIVTAPTTKQHLYLSH